MPALDWKKFRASLVHLAMLAAFFGGFLVVRWEVWPRVESWRQRLVARQLSEQVAKLPDDQVSVPLRELASAGKPGLRALVEAVASERTAVSRIARREIDNVFSASVTQMYESPSEQTKETLLELAAALADNVEQFGPTGQRWAQSWTMRLIEISERLPLGQASQLLSATSRTLERIPRLGLLETIATELPAAQPPREEEVREEPPEAVRTFPELEEALAQPLPPPPEEPPVLAAPLREPQEAWIPRWIGVRRIPPPQPPPPIAGDASLSVQVREGATSVPLEVPTPLEFKRRLTDLRRQSTEELLQQLTTADKFAAGAIRTVLNERGIDAVEAETAAHLKTTDEAGRLQMVSAAAQLPAIAARRMLRLLLNDPSGEVRLRALSTLATTNDPELAVLARTLAVEDKDPRVAELATKLLRK